MRRPDKSTIVLICCTLVIVTLFIYWPVRSFDFVNYDDPDYVTENPIVQQGLTRNGLIWAFGSGHAYNWHPLTWLSHMLDCEIFGPKPLGHHFTNVIFHALNSLLLFLVLHRMTKAIWKSALVAALFAWHPLHIESVAWVCERKDVLSTLFWILSLYAYTRYTEKPTKIRYLFVVVPFVIGLMAKPMLVTLPFVFLLLDFWPLRRIMIVSSGKSRKQIQQPVPAQRLFLEKIPLFVIAFAASLVTFLVQKSAGAVAQMDWFPISERIGNAAVSYTRYLEKTFWPTDLSVFYPYLGWQTWQIIAAVSILTIISGVTLGLRRTKPFLVVGWLWFLGTLVPVIGLVQVGTQAIADRYTYVPLIGFFISLVWGITAFIGKPSQVKDFGMALASGIILLACLLQTRVQLQYWRNSETLFSHAIKVTDRNLVAHVMLGNDLHKSGRFDEAKSQYEKALKIRPDSPDVYYNLGNLMVAQKQLDEAIAYYRRAIEINPAHTDAHVNMAVTLGMKGNYADAILNYKEALKINPNDPVALHNLAMDLIPLGQYEEAITYLQRAIALNPNDVEAQQLLKRLADTNLSKKN